MNNIRECVISYKTSIKSFPINTQCDFKYNIPSDCQNIFTLGIAIRKISCKFVNSNFTVSDSPSIILSDFQEVGCTLYDIL